MNDNILKVIEEGYTPGAPSEEAAQIDRIVANHAECPECGHDGMKYSPWIKPGSYRPFAVCPECGHATEF